MPDLHLDWLQLGYEQGSPQGYYTATDSDSATISASDASGDAVDYFEIDYTFTGLDPFTSVYTYFTNGYVESGEPFSSTNWLKISDRAHTGATSDTASITLDFNSLDPALYSSEVTGVSFRLSDLDVSDGFEDEGDPPAPDYVTQPGNYHDIVQVIAYNALGESVPVTFTPAGAAVVSGDTVSGGATTHATDADGSVLVTIDGPVSRLEIIYGNLEDNYQVLDISEIYFSSIDTIGVEDDTATTPENVPVVIDVLANDTHPDGDTLTVDGATAEHGTVVINPDGTLTYTPDTDYSGPDSITYTVISSGGDEGVGTVDVTVTPVNEDPDAVDDSQTVAANTTLVFDPTVNDTDADGDPLTVTAVGTALNGTVSIDGSGQIVYVPNTDFNGVDEFTYTISDGQGGSDTATVTVTVGTGPNDDPEAVDDSADAIIGEATVIDVLDNDTDADGDTLTVTAVGGASNGTVVINGDGTVTYTGDAGFEGTDSFTYTVSDGNGGTDTATVTVTVSPAPNADPEAVTDTAAVFAGDTVVVDVLGNDTDADGDTLTVSSLGSALNGTVVQNPDGTVSYTPDAGFLGVDEFTYEVSDGNGGTDTATVRVTVSEEPNSGPDAVNDLDSTLTNTPIVLDILGNDTDPDGDTLSITSLGSALNGSVTLNGDGTVTYTPDTGFRGTDVFTYSISDGNGGTDTAEVRITVADAPNEDPIAGDDTAATTENSAVVISLLGNDSDPDGDTITIQSLGMPLNGAVTLDPGGTTVTYTPDPGFTGVDEFTYVISDGRGGTDEATVVVTVNEDPNEDPVAAGDLATTVAGEAVSISVLGNDTDPDGDTLSVSGIESGPLNGSVVINGDGTITYTPNAGFTGADEFTYEVSDGNGGTDTASVVVTVNAPANDAPNALPDRAATTIGSSVNVDVLGNDTDPDGDPLTVTSVDAPLNGTATINGDGTITYTPNAGFTGTDAFFYTIEDGNGGSDTSAVIITVSAPLNYDPEALNDAASTLTNTAVVLPVLDNDTDADGDPLTITDIATPLNGTVVQNADGTLTYTPDTGFVGADSFTYTISDGQGGTDTATIVVTVNADPNAAPDAVDDDATTEANTPIVLDILGNDSDPDGDALNILAVGTPLNGTARLNADGTVTYTPHAGFTGTDTFVYTISDGNGHSDTATVTVNMTAPPNSVPQAVYDSTATEVDTSVTIDILENDHDLDGDALTVTGTTEPLNGTVSINEDGTVTYTPNAGFVGTDVFIYTITDGISGSASAAVTVNVSADPNAEPDAVDDSVTTGFETSTVINVLDNDSDPDGDGLSILSVGTPEHGVARLHADGTITYTPHAGFEGTDSFTYTIADENGASDTATVTITVEPSVNLDPEASDDTAETTIGQPVTIEVLANDSDPNGDDLSIPLVSSPLNGSVVLNGDGTITYTPNAGFEGTDEFVYSVSDGFGGSDTARVVITVAGTNADPLAVDDADSTEPGTPITLDILANDSDADGDPLTITALGAALNGTVVLNGDGTVTYTPNAGFEGTDSFEYTISDGEGGTNSATVRITVSHENSDPVAVDDSISTPEGTAVVLDLLDNDTDADGDTLSIDSLGTALNGTVVLNGDGTVTYTPNAGFAGTDSFEYTVSDGNGGTDTATATITVTDVSEPDPTAVDDVATTVSGEAVTIAVLDNDSDPESQPLSVSALGAPLNGTVVLNGDGTVTYTPNAGFTGTDSFEYTISDGNGGTDTATATITVTEPNGDPDADDDSASTLIDAPVVISVLGNDSDPEDDPLTVTSITTPGNGSVVINGDGTVTYTPNAGFEGTDSFDYTVSDGEGGTDTATVTVTVSAPPNEDPEAADDSASTTAGEAVVISVLGNDTDPEGDPLSVASVGSASNGTVVVNGDGTVTYTPNAGFIGTDSFDYTISDGEGGSDVATVTVTVGARPNTDPEAVNDNAATFEGTPVVVSLLGNDSDPEDDPLTVTGVGTALNGTVVLNGDGTATYTPNAGFVGNDRFEYTISDGQGGTDTAFAFVSVSADDGDPVAANDAVGTDQDTPVVIDVLANDADPDGDTLSVTAVGTPSNGTATLNADGTVTYTPNAGFVGSDSFTYDISDGNGGTDTATVTITVADTEADPVARDDASGTSLDRPLVIDVLGNDSDADGDTLRTVGVGTPDNGTAVVNADGTVTYTPNAGFSGTDSFDYTITDGNGGFDTATVTVQVSDSATNLPPVAVADSYETPPGEAVTFDVRDNDSDPEGGQLTVGDLGTPSNGTVVLNADGTVTYTPNAGFTGSDSFTYVITDPAGEQDTGTVTVEVSEDANRAPQAVDDIRVADFETALTLDPRGNDSDPDGDPLTVTAVGDAGNGTVVLNGDGTVTYTPEDGFVGTDSFEYTISDGEGGSDTAWVTISVAGPEGNQRPVAADDTASTTSGDPVIVSVLGNDTDPDSDPLSVIAVGTPTNGTAVLNDDGTVTYTPADGFTGTDSFEYVISDGQGGEDIATVTVTVSDGAGPNSDPDAVDDSATTAVDTAVAISVLANDTDPDGDLLSTLTTTSPLNGSVSINPDGTVTYTPNAGFTGRDRFEYTISDGEGGTDTATVIVDVGTDPIDNNAPTANDDAVETQEDTAVTLSPLSNDTDPDDDTLTITTLGVPGNGTIVLNGDGTVTYTPNAGFSGVDTVEYTISDGNGETSTATITITVTPEGQPPEANDDIAATFVGRPVTLAVLGNDSDPDGDTIRLSAITETPENGTAVLHADGTITYTPNAGFSGTDTLTYQIADPQGNVDTATVTITVIPEDAPPPSDGIIDTDIFPVSPDLQPLDPYNNLDQDPSPPDNIDSVDGTEGADLISTGDDRDTINAGAGDDTIFGGIDDDLIDAGDGDDSINDTQGADTVRGGAGNDTIFVGSDTLSSFSDYVGDDGRLPFLGFTADPSSDDERDSVDGGAGDDLISTGDDRDTIDGGTGNDTINSGIDDDSVVGGEGDDVIYGGHGSDTISGDDGDDYIDGSNDDSLSAPDSTDAVPQNDRDLLRGGAGNDTIIGGDDDDTLYGEAGRDILMGGIDEDELYGGDDSDTLHGGAQNDTLTGGAGADALYGEADRDVFVIDDHSDGFDDTVDGGADGDDFDRLMISGTEGVDWRIVNAVTDSDGNGIDGTVEFLDGAGNVTGSFQFYNIETTVPCFTPGTLIATEAGERLIEDLQVGDRVLTRDNGAQEIRWIGTRVLSGFDLACAPQLRPIRIRQGALGNGLPEHDMIVSPHHRVLVASAKTELYFDEAEVLVAAKHLLGMEGVEQLETLGVTYIHVMFDQHEILLSNGAWTESFQPGAETLKGIEADQRDELLTLFPELAETSGQEAFVAARPTLRSHEAALLR